MKIASCKVDACESWIRILQTCHKNICIAMIYSVAYLGQSLYPEIKR